ncbi:hypothetical protein [Caproiciproducens sp.]
MQNSCVIYSPGKDVVAMLRRRLSAEARSVLDQMHFEAVALIQTSVPNLFYFADIGQKSGKVFAAEITGSCPQHITTLALFGNTESVKMAMKAIERTVQDPNRGE